MIDVLSRELRQALYQDYLFALSRGNIEEALLISKKIALASERLVLVESEEYQLVRKTVLAKNPKCQTCGLVERLEVDHIVPVSEGGLELDASNLQVLCHNCHKEKTRQELRKRHKEYDF